MLLDKQLVIILLTFLPIVSAQLDHEFDHGVDLPTTRPLIIAHRGSCGALPEHTVEAYVKAVEDGADVIECDVVVTKDLHLVCRHESWLNGYTDAEEVFPEERKSTYYVDDQGRSITDYFTVDFTLEELKQLTCKQRYSYRDHNYNGLYQISTLEEYIMVAQSAGRPVGIYPETKDPIWVNSLDIIKDANTTFEDLLLDVVHQHGYTETTDPCFIQSFNEDSIRYMSERTNLPIVYLTGTVTNNKLEDLSQFCYGIGTNRNNIAITANDNIIRISDFVERIQSYGMRVHPYTFRNEYDHLAWDYEQDPYQEYLLFQQLGVDGYFTDFTLSLSRFLNMSYQANC